MIWSELFNKKTIVSPTLLTLLRGVMAIMLPFFLLSPEPSKQLAGFFIFVVAAITDFLDGWMARKYNLITDLGKILDPITDKLLILITLAIFASLGYFSKWWLVPIFAREISVTFCRIGILLEGKAIAAEKMGKIKFGAQVATIVAALILLLSTNYSFFQWFHWLAKIVLPLGLVVTTILTIYSGFQFYLANSASFKSKEFAKYVSALGVGLFPKAPGTWGSLVGMIVMFLVHWNIVLYLLTAIFFIWLGYWAVSRLDLSEEKDPGFVVVDEFAGIMVTFLLVPLSYSSMVIGFFLFRLFDIMKPPPCKKLEQMSGYWGILNDDLMAGVYSLAILVLAFGLTL